MRALKVDLAANVLYCQVSASHESHEQPLLAFGILSDEVLRILQLILGLVLRTNLEVIELGLGDYSSREGNAGGESVCLVHVEHLGGRDGSLLGVRSLLE